MERVPAAGPGAERICVQLENVKVNGTLQRTFRLERSHSTSDYCAVLRQTARLRQSGDGRRTALGRAGAPWKKANSNNKEKTQPDCGLGPESAARSLVVSSYSIVS